MTEMACNSNNPPPDSFTKNRSKLVNLAIDILETEKNFQCVSILGQGTYGDVFRMYDPGRDQDMAVKIVTPENISEKELIFWPKLRHRNIVPLLEVMTLGPWSTSVFIMPLQRKNLHDVLCDKRFLLRRGCYNKVKEWLFEVLSALEYIRSKQFCHLDIKVDNVLISHRSTAMLCDFSFLNVTIAPLKRYDLGLPYIYRPPEACQSLGKKIRIDGRSYDMWGYGVMVVEILTHFVLASNVPDSHDWCKDVYPTLFDALQEKEFAKALVRTFPADPIDQHDIHLGLNFVHSFLAKDCLKRISPIEAMRHMFLNHGTFTGWMVDPIWMYKETFETPVYEEKATQTVDNPGPWGGEDATGIDAEGDSDDQYLTISESEGEDETDSATEISEGEEVKEEEKLGETHLFSEVEGNSPDKPDASKKADIRHKTEFQETDVRSNHFESPIDEDDTEHTISELNASVSEISNVDICSGGDLEELSHTLSQTNIDNCNRLENETTGEIKSFSEHHPDKDTNKDKDKDEGETSSEADFMERYRIYKQSFEEEAKTDTDSMDGSFSDPTPKAEKLTPIEVNSEPLLKLYQKIQKEFLKESKSAPRCMKDIEELIKLGSFGNQPEVNVYDILESQGATGDSPVANLEETVSTGFSVPPGESGPFEQSSTLLEDNNEPFSRVSNDVRDLRGRLGELDKMFEELEKTLVCEHQCGPEEPSRDWELTQKSPSNDGSNCSEVQPPVAMEQDGVLFKEQSRSETVLKANPEVFGKVIKRKTQSLSKRVSQESSDASTDGSGNNGRCKKLRKWLRERRLDLERFAQKKPYRILK